MLRCLSIALVAMLAIAPAVHAEEEEAPKLDTLKVGDKAPDFDLPDADKAPEGAPKKLSDFKGKKNVLLAFYPKAKTSGCTKQLCGYRDAADEFKGVDAEIIAISIDEQDYSNEFKEEQKMPFFVLGDTDGSVISSYGIPTKEYNGNNYAQRSVMIVDKEGVIRFVEMKYNIGKHQEVVLKELAKLEKGE